MNEKLERSVYRGEAQCLCLQLYGYAFLDSFALELNCVITENISQTKENASKEPIATYLQNLAPVGEAVHIITRLIHPQGHTVQ